MMDTRRVSIPSTWTRVPIGQVADTAAGGTPKRGSTDYYGGDIPWVKSGELRDGFVHTAEETITELGLRSSNAKLFPKGTVCIALYGATIGKAAILEINAATNQAVCGIFLPPQIDRRYFFYFLLSVRHDLIALGQGGAQSNISNELVRQTYLALAPESEQSRIADRIDELFTDLAAGVAALERVRKKLKRYRSAVLHAAVTGRLTEAWRQEHGAASRKRDAESGEQLLERLLVERRRQWEERTLAEYESKGTMPPKNWRQRYQEPVEPKTDDLPELPEGWCWASQDHVGEVQLGRQRSPQHHTGEHMRPYLRVANVFEDRISTHDVKSMNFTPREFETYELRHGDLLLNEGQSMELIGRPAMYRDEIPGCCFQNTLIRQRVGHGVLPEYALSVLLAQFKTGRYRKIARITTSIAHLGAERFAGLEFPLPPTAEQQAIVELVQEKFSQIDAMEAEVNRGLARASRLRQAILKSAFAGELIEQDPNDEPASALLDRIRAEREAMTAQSNGRPKRATRKKAAPMKKATKSAKRKSTKKKARNS